MIARGAVLLALAALAAGCDRRRDLDDPFGRQIAEAIPAIEHATGLKFLTPPRLELRTRDEARDFLLAKFSETSPAEMIRGVEMAYKAFGFVDDTLDLQRFLLDLLTEQVAGYYDPVTKAVYLVRDAPDHVARIVLTHELVHALQDQHLNLDSIQRMRGNSDRQAAAQAVIEGQATWVQMKIALGGDDFATRMPGGWEAVRQQIREAQTAMPRFAAAPMVLQESLIFPYLAGAEFVRRFDMRRDPRLPLSALPVSTEQVLSEQAFFGEPPDLPTTVSLPGRMPAGGFEEVMGQFGIRLFLLQHGRDAAVAVSGAAGWDGDRYRVFPVRGGRAVVWASVWDTPVDAAEFVDAAGQATLRRYRAGAPSTSGTTRSYLGSGRSVTISQRAIGGRNVVVFVDVPAGTAGPIIDPARITLGDS